MKTTTWTVFLLTALALAPAFGQEAPRPPAAPQPPRLVPSPPGPGAPPATAPGASGFSERLQKLINRSGEPDAAPALTRFDLDFPGGTPKELVAAIEKAMGRPLNAIVPEELAETKLPALKMNGVDVPQLFQALAAASRKSEAVVSGTSYGGGAYGGYQSIQTVITGFGFRQGSEGKPTDDTIWCFYVEKPSLPPLSSSAKVCHFYSLGPYLDRGYTVDDITTAIETGWKMLEDTTPPRISFHKDTKLLIAVGEPSKLETIDAVLKALGQPSPRSSVPGMASIPHLPAAPPAPKPAERKNEN